MKATVLVGPFACPRFHSAVGLLLSLLTLVPSAARGQEPITEKLNTAAAVVGIGALTADVGFTLADIILAARKQRLSPRWSVVEIVCAVPISMAAIAYSFQARPEELLLTIPIAVWTGGLGAHGIGSLWAERRGRSLSLDWAPTYAMGHPGMVLGGRF